MEALILSCGTGGGHNMAAKAIESELCKRGHKVSLLNPYHLQSSRTALYIDQLYIKTVQKTPRTFGVVYQLGNVVQKFPFKSPVYYANWKMADVLHRYLQENPVDFLITTHLYAAEIITCMKEKKYPLPPTMFIGTDYTCIPFTEETDCDYYVIPQKDLTEVYLKNGFPLQKLYPLGIPVDNRFLLHLNAEDAYEKYSLSRDQKYILITGGSMGAGQVKKTVQILYQHYQGTNVSLIVICGSNRKMYSELKEKYGNDIRILQQTSHMAVYMKVSALVITKPGGLTSTEAAVAEVPILHISPIPGCETKNAAFFAQRNMSIRSKVNQKICRVCDDILSGDMSEMLCSQRKYINKRAAEDICDLVEKVL